MKMSSVRGKAVRTRVMSMDITATQEMNSKASEIIPCAQETVVWI